MVAMEEGSGGGAPSAPDLQLDWVSSSESSDNEDNIQVLLVHNSSNGNTADNKPVVVDLTLESDDDITHLPGNRFLTIAE